MSEQKTLQVGVVFGSKSDWPVMQSAAQQLEKFGIAFEARVLSAHRTPDDTVEWIRSCERRGVQVFIAAAGGAAHLAGAVAAQTVRPVLGVPMPGWALDGLDSLLSTVQMPRGIPVGTLAIGKAGAHNAALLAVQILALHDESLAEALKSARRADRDAILDTALD